MVTKPLGPLQLSGTVTFSKNKQTQEYGLVTIIQNTRLKEEVSMSQRQTRGTEAGGTWDLLPAYHDSQTKAKEWEFLKQMPVK